MFVLPVQELVQQHRRNLANIRLIAGRRARRGLDDPDFLRDGQLPAPYNAVVLSFESSGGASDADSSRMGTDVSAEERQARACVCVCACVRVPQRIVCTGFAAVHQKKCNMRKTRLLPELSCVRHTHKTSKGNV